MWKIFDPTNPPERWCLIRFKSLRVVDAQRLTKGEKQDIGKVSEERDYAILARWSERGYCFINQDLMSIPSSSKDVDSYIETPYATIDEVFKAFGAIPSQSNT